MPLDPYASCPCGSGKKFKWCCAPYYPQIERAIEQDRNGQHETALATIQALTKEHGDKPPVWGYYAQVLYNGGQAEQADEALATALKLNPSFGMAYFLRGMFRQNEGELIGALMLFRKAADAYDPEAHDALTQVHELIFRNELILNRPVAARAALERAVRFQPADVELKQQFDALFGDNSRLPTCARKPYTLRPTAKPVPAAAATGKLIDARKAYDELVKATPDDPAAWFNLGVCRAWLGEQPQAVEALNKSVDLETDDHRAEEAAALVEVLRCGQGMENEADYLEYGVFLPIRDPQPVMAYLQGLEQSRRLLGVQVNQENGTITAMVVDELPSLLAVGGTTLAKVVAKVTLANGVVHLWHPNKASVLKVAGDLRDKVMLAVEQPVEQTRPVNFGDVALEALVYPSQTSDINQAEEKLRDHARHYFEETWAHRPLKGLGGATPLDAVGSKVLRKRLFGAIKFVEDSFVGVVPHKRVGNEAVPMAVYDFAALRHKLGLEYVSAAPPSVNVPADAPAAAETRAPDAPRPQAPAAKRDIGAMNAADLAGLDVASLSGDDLEQAMRAALKLDARDLAVAFAQAGTLKPADAAKPDRYPLYACLIAGATAEGDPARAVAVAEAGAAFDAAHNDGKRANEYGLQKAKLYAKLKDTDKAAAEFDGLIERSPDEPKFYTAAAEAMLGARNGMKALAFAEKGLAKAKQTGNRDLEGHSRELIEAARRLG